MLLDSGIGRHIIRVWVSGATLLALDLALEHTFRRCTYRTSGRRPNGARAGWSEQNRPPSKGGTVKRSLTIAAVLGVVLLVAVVLAAEGVWDCPLCLGLYDPGTAYYTCPTHGVFPAPAYWTDEYTGPPDRVCPFCSTSCDADSAVCNTNSSHRWYAPFWQGYK